MDDTLDLRKHLDNEDVEDDLPILNPEYGPLQIRELMSGLITGIYPTKSDEEDKSKKKDEFAQDTWVVDVKMIVTNTQLAHLALNTKDHVFLMIVEGR